jgi:hypothetical protein
MIENWHSILTHYVNRNVAVVTHENYSTATCVAQQCRKLKKRLDEELLKKKSKPPERLGLLLQLQNEAFDETNANVANFLLEPFRDMVMLLKADGRCSGKYADELWPRLNWQAEGQDKLAAALKDQEAFLASRKWVPAAAPVGLLGWLNDTAQTLTAVHKPECVRRGIAGPGLKGALSERIVAHVVAHPGGFVYSGTEHEACPLGYRGDLPTEAPLCCCCKEDGCVAKAAVAAAKEAAVAAEAEATAKAAVQLHYSI